MQEKHEGRAFDISMKLGMWEGGSVNGDVRQVTPKAKDKHKRSLQRDNSSGSNVSNVSNISNLSNNSNISILSTSSTGSGRASTRLSPGAYDPAAAAAASRQRFLTTSSRDLHEHQRPRHEEIQVREPSFVDSSTDGWELGGATTPRTMSLSQPPSRASSRPPSQAPSKDNSLRSVASHELMVESSPEPSPSSSPRNRVPAADDAAAPLSDTTMAIKQAAAAQGRAVDPSQSVPGETAVSSPQPTSAAAPAAMAGVVACAVRLQSVLKKQRRSMSPLVTRREGLQSARSSWVAGAHEKLQQQQEQQSPRGVKFTPSTKSMGNLRAKEATAEGAGPEDETIEQEGHVDRSGQADVAIADIEIEGAVAVEEEGEDEEGHGTAAEGSAVLTAVGEQAGRTALSERTGEQFSPRLLLPRSVTPPAGQETAFTSLSDAKHSCSAGAVVSSCPTPSPSSVCARTPTVPSAAESSAEDRHATLEDRRVPLTELVRRNKLKDFGDLVSTELEVYLGREEFERTFRLSREAFYELPLWRQRNQKRSVGLF
jgi:hypothetical protein